SHRSNALSGGPGASGENPRTPLAPVAVARGRDGGVRQLPSLTGSFRRPCPDGSIPRSLPEPRRQVFEVVRISAPLSVASAHGQQDSLATDLSRADNSRERTPDRQWHPHRS